MAINDTSRRQKSLNNRRNGVCRCERFHRRNGPPQDARSFHEESLGRTFTIDENSIAEPRFYSTRISAEERNNADHRDTEFDADELLPSCDCNDSDIRDDRRQRDITGIRTIEQRDEHAEPIPGPSRDFARTLSPVLDRKPKKARLEDRIVQRADENDEETTTEEDMDCTCDTNEMTRVIRDEHSRRRPLDRTRVVIRNGQRNGQRRERDEEKENEEDEEKVEEEDEDTEDSAYRELKPRISRRRNTARERELKRWIRRCRQECERRKAR